MRTNKINLQKAMALRISNKLSYQDIGIYFGVSKQAVAKALKPLIDNNVDMTSIKQQRIDLMEYTQASLISSITKEVVEKAGLKDRVTSFGILYDREQREASKTGVTENYGDLVVRVHEQRKLEANKMMATNQLPSNEE